VQEFIDFVKHHKLLEPESGIDESVIHATGGGAYKYHDLFQKEFEGKVKMCKHDEMQSLVDGMSFVLSFAKNPSYTLKTGEGKKIIESYGKFGTFYQEDSQERQTEIGNEILNVSNNIENFDISDTTSLTNSNKSKLLVSIGSGVSMIKVDPNGSFERVNGTMIGGGTLVGLTHMITGIRDFD